MALRPSVRLVAAAGLVALVAVSSGATGVSTAPQAATASSWLPRDEEPLPLELVLILRQSSYDFFRAANRAWAERVCEAFEADPDALAPVRLHGDAHVEQYAVTDSAYGLDDFDDTSKGPAVIDLVRFIGSLELAARNRGWVDRTDKLASEFLRGYRRGLEDPGYMPATPAFVEQLRRGPVRDRQAFLAWAEDLMVPVSPRIAERARAALALLAAHAAKERPELSPTYFAVKKVGGFHLGVGSRRVPKLLVRTDGPSSAADDDLILEAKEPADLTGVSCLSPAEESPAVRIITGARQIGRLHHEVLSLVPEMTRDNDAVRHWWIHDWMPSYQEISVPGLRSAADLAALARDAGAQLGSASLPMAGDAARETRRRQIKTIKRLERRVREVARRLTDDMLAGWQAFRRQPPDR